MALAVYPGSFDPLTVAHLAIAATAVVQVQVQRVDLALSTQTLGKAPLDRAALDRRAEVLRRQVADRPWIGVVVVDDSLIADIARGYDVVVMGADKWAQVRDPSWYDHDVSARDRALARLPRVAVATHGGFDVPDGLRLEVPEHLSQVSATAVRNGRREWAAGPVLR